MKRNFANCGFFPAVDVWAGFKPAFSWFSHGWTTKRKKTTERRNPYNDNGFCRGDSWIALTVANRTREPCKWESRLFWMILHPFRVPFMGVRFPRVFTLGYHIFRLQRRIWPDQKTERNQRHRIIHMDGQDGLDTGTRKIWPFRRPEKPDYSHGYTGWTG